MFIPTEAVIQLIPSEEYPPFEEPDATNFPPPEKSAQIILFHEVLSTVLQLKGESIATCVFFFGKLIKAGNPLPTAQKISWEGDQVMSDSADVVAEYCVVVQDVPPSVDSAILSLEIATNS